MPKQTVAQWAKKNYSNTKQQIMLWPVIVYRARKSVGIGTWVVTPALSTVITAHHLFRKIDGVMEYSAQTLGRTKTLFGLQKPRLIQNVPSADVVMSDVALGGYSPFAGDWEGHEYKSPRTGGGKLKNPRTINSLITGESLELTLRVQREDGTDNLVALGDPDHGQGESGTGYIGDNGKIYVRLGSSEESSQLLFSNGIAIKF